MRLVRALAVGIALLVAAGCASSLSSQSFPRNQAQTAYQVDYGEVVSVRAVEIEGEGGFVGAIVGSEAGRALGSTVEDRSRRRIARAVGSVAGAIAGQAVERELTSEDGLEITVNLDNSDTIAIVQADDVAFVPGERVRVLRGYDGTARVNRL